MTSSSPDRRAGDRGRGVLRGADALLAETATFDVQVAIGDRRITGDRRTATADAVGYAAGWAGGQRAARTAGTAASEQIAAAANAAAAQRVEQLARAMSAVTAAAAELERRTVQSAAEIEDILVQTAFDLAEAVLGRALSAAESPGRDAVRRALTLAPTNRPVLVRLNPDDYAALISEDGHGQGFDGRTVTFRADPGLARGDAVAESGDTAIDARIDAALQRAREVLAA